MKKSLLSVTIISALFCGSAHADFVKTDWLTQNDRQAVLDTDTGLEWLNNDQTLGWSIDRVSAELGEGKKFDGWRLPTPAEVAETLSNFTSTRLGLELNAPLYALEQLDYGGPSLHFMAKSVFGGTTCTVSGSYCSTYDRYASGAYSYGYVHGYVFDENAVDANSEALIIGLTYRHKNGSPTLSAYNWFRNGDQDSDTSRSYAAASRGVSVWLVSDGGTTLSSKSDPTLNSANPRSPVNNVPAAGLVLSTLAMLGIALRRKKTQLRNT